jgi:hypothetical protein
MLPCVALARTDFSEERWFLQEPHDTTSQKTAFFISHRHENLKSYTKWRGFYGTEYFSSCWTGKYNKRPVEYWWLDS